MDVEIEGSRELFTLPKARCLDHAIHIHGGMGETLELPRTLFYRLLRHAQVGGGTSEIHRMLIARSVLR